MNNELNNTKKRLESLNEELNSLQKGLELIDETKKLDEEFKRIPGWRLFKRQNNLDRRRELLDKVDLLKRDVN